MLAQRRKSMKIEVWAVYFLWIVPGYALQHESSGERIKSLATLATRVYLEKKRPTPDEIQSIKIPTTLKDKFARQWSEQNPELVPFFLQPLTVQNGVVEKSFFEDNKHFHFLRLYDEQKQCITIVDILSGFCVKAINATRSQYDSLVFSRQQDSLMLKLKEGTLYFCNLKNNESLWYDYSDRNVDVLEFDVAKNFLLMAHHYHHYIRYDLDPWQRRYTITVPNGTLAASVAFVGTTKDHIVVHDTLNKRINFFDLDTGRFSWNIESEKGFEDILLSNDQQILSVTKKKEINETFIYSLSHNKKETVLSKIDGFHNFSLLTGNDFYCSSFNHVGSCKTGKFHSCFYCCPKEIKTEVFCPKIHCTDHNLLLVLSDAEKKWLVGPAKNPQTLNELLLRLSAADLIGVKKKHGIPSLESFNKTRLLYTKIQDPMTRKAVLGVLASYFQEKFLP